VNAIRKFLADTVDLVMDLLRLVGLRGPRWEFRKQAIRRRILGVSADLENLRRGVRTEHKMCRECRALMPSGSRHCPECGASTRGIPRGGLGRLLGLLFPGFASITSVLVTVNVAVYLISLVIFAESGPSASPLAGPSSRALWMLGAKASLTAGGESFPAAGPPLWQLYRLVLPNFLHGPIFHILFNSLFLMNVGPLAEHLAGRRRFLVTYILTGISGFAASTLMSLNPSVGSSASLFGLFGFVLVFGRLQGGAAGRALSTHLMRWLVFLVVLSLLPRVDFWAHLGGFALGAGLGAFFRSGEPRTRRDELALNAAAAVSVALVAISVVGLGLDWSVNLAF
jgi:membrane associated rhomboid family serine protease